MDTPTRPDSSLLKDTPSLSKSEQKRAIGAGMVGYVLEWFDFGIYGFLAPTIASNFFPTHNGIMSLLASFGVFGVGFVARPIGSVILGRFADIRGRHQTLAATMLLMAASTMLIGLLPTYASIGIAAPILLVGARLLQGFAAGGEWGTAAAFLVEWGGSRRRGMFGAFQQSSIAAGLMLASFTAAALNSLFNQEQLIAWGWRIPFLLGVVLGPVGYYVRKNVKESPTFRKSIEKPEAMSRGQFWRAVLHGFSFLIFWSVASYMVAVYMPAFATKYAHIDASVALWSGTINLAMVVVLAPFAGLLSDKIGRKRILVSSCLFFTIFSYPIYVLIVSGLNGYQFFTVHLFMTVMFILYSGCGPAALAELFPTHLRSTGVSIGAGMAAVFGGFSPFLTTWTISLTGASADAGWLLTASALVTLPALLSMRDRSGLSEI
jgi:MFS transporter, MHS family, proline/betaine transporter